MRRAPAPSPDFTAELNEAQRAAATFADGPLLIVAGAGTGKTRTLVYRVAHLIARGVPPQRILLLTFTRRAAQEMLGRAERLVGSASGRVHGGTFHATAHRLLRAYGGAVGLPRDFTILDQGDATDLMGIARARLGHGQRDTRFPRKETLHHVYSRHVNTDIPVERILREEYPRFAEHTKEFLRIFAEYTARKSERNLVDYDDLLLFWATMLEESPELGERIASLYDHVLVDEYQDTNALQARILRGMCRTHRNISVVGDDAQSIYSFRGATVRNILDFPEQFPGATVITLERNYRSTHPVLDTTNTLISRARERYTKNLWTERTGGERPLLVAASNEHEQTRWVVDRVLELYEAGTPLREMAVLFRAGYLSADLEIELMNRKIPFEKWGGLKFLEAAHVKDVLAFLRILENPRDELSWYRVLQLLPGIGEATARRVVDRIAEQSWDAHALTTFTPPPRARKAYEAFVRLLDELRAAASASPEHPVSTEIAQLRTMYDEILRERYDRPEPRLADLDHLEMIAAKFPSRSAFLAELALEPPSSTQELAGPGDSDDDALILSTAHSAKGREWDAVFVIWAVDGAFPSQHALRSADELEEERRLLYVAMTRARHQLAVLYPLQSYGMRFSTDYFSGQLSRFLDPGVREHMELISAHPEAVPGVGSEGPAPVEALDLRAVMRARFGGGESAAGE
jgi:DNA helicase-2/ATP-dependent DNA helicase PcrA